MDLIIGGAHQGKLDYARAKYNLTCRDIFTCNLDGTIDFTRRCIYRIEEYALCCVENGISPLTVLKKFGDLWKDSIIICTDISCGVVPVDDELRRWREETGFMLNYLSQNADSVTRIFFGLEQRLK